MKRPAGILIVFAVLLGPVCLLAVMTLVGLVTHDTRFALESRTDAQLFFMAESGLAVAERAFADSNFTAVTHNSDLTPAAAGDPDPMKLPNLSGLPFQRETYFGGGGGPDTSDHPPGDYVFNQRMVDGPEPQEIRFRVRFDNPRQWIMECEAIVGTRRVKHVQTGVTQPAFDFVSFANGNDDFNGAADASIRGPVHANGTLELRPTGGSRVEFLSFIPPTASQHPVPASVTAAGRILRSGGAGEVWIEPKAGGPLREMVGGAGGTAMDSDNPLWEDPVSGAPGLWGGSVSDGSLGTGPRAPPGLDAFKPGGHYEQIATVRIEPGTPDNGDWLSTSQFFNRGEGRLVTVREIDVGALCSNVAPSPDGGLRVYSEVPVRLTNATVLPYPVTLACNSTIYVKGDFNTGMPAGQVYGAALITHDRVWMLTSGFQDRLVNAPPGLASDDITINAAIVNGQIPGDGAIAFLNLEDMTGRTVTVRGCYVGLQNAEMAPGPSDNSGLTEGMTAWVLGGERRVGNEVYPPVGDFSPYYLKPAARNLYYDPVVLTAPELPMVSRKIFWDPHG